MVVISDCIGEESDNMMEELVNTIAGEQVLLQKKKGKGNKNKNKLECDQKREGRIDGMSESGGGSGVR